MKIDRNDPAHSIPASGGYDVWGGIPLRLEIASRILAGALANPEFTQDFNRKSDDEIAKRILSAADALIEAHNQTYQEKK